jgi:hypothetical protein
LLSLRWRRGRGEIIWRHLKHCPCLLQTDLIQFYSDKVVRAIHMLRGNTEGFQYALFTYISGFPSIVLQHAPPNTAHKHTRLLTFGNVERIFNESWPGDWTDMGRNSLKAQSTNAWRHTSPLEMKEMAVRLEFTIDANDRSDIMLAV